MRLCFLARDRVGGASRAASMASDRQTERGADAPSSAGGTSEVGGTGTRARHAPAPLAICII